MTKASTYFVGAASVDITPALNKPVYLAGFPPNRTALSVLHPLEAGALYVRDEKGGELCFVTVDVIGLLQPDIERIRSRVTHRIPRERVIICSTHTHSGPDTLGLWGKAFAGVPYKSGVDPEYMALLVERVSGLIIEALDDAATGTLHAASFNFPRGWVRNDRAGGGEYRRTVALCARRNDEDLAVMLNFAAHPEALWEKNRAISPDYPGPFRNRMRSRGVKVPLFFCGPIGAMLTPAVAPRAKLPERERYIEHFGHMLAETTLEKCEGAKPLTGAIAVESQAIDLPNRNPRFEFAKRVKFIDRPIEDGVIKTKMAAGAIGGFRFVTMPGEPSPEVGHEIYYAMEGEHRMLLALGLDELGYIIPAPFFANREYRYEQSMSVGAHLAPTLLENLNVLNKRLNG